MIVFSEHAETQILTRKISKAKVLDIYTSPDSYYYDVINSSTIAVKKIKYGENMKDITVAFIKDGNDVIIRTVHPSGKNEVRNRIREGRYAKYGNK